MLLESLVVLLGMHGQKIDIFKPLLRRISWRRVICRAVSSLINLGTSKVPSEWYEYLR